MRQRVGYYSLLARLRLRQFAFGPMNLPPTRCRERISGRGNAEMNDKSWRERWRDYWQPGEEIETSPVISDEVKYTTCYMCAGRCGIKVHLKNGGIRYIEGNKAHPVNHGVICGKGASGIMHQQSPAK